MASPATRLGLWHWRSLRRGRSAFLNSDGDRPDCGSERHTSGRAVEAVEANSDRPTALERPGRRSRCGQREVLGGSDTSPSHHGNRAVSGLADQLEVRETPPRVRETRQRVRETLTASGRRVMPVRAPPAGVQSRVPVRGHADDGGSPGRGRVRVDHCTASSCSPTDRFEHQFVHDWWRMFNPDEWDQRSRARDPHRRRLG